MYIYMKMLARLGSRVFHAEQDEHHQRLGVLVEEILGVLVEGFLLTSREAA